MPGIVNLLENNPFPKGTRFSMATNDASRLPDGRLTRVALLEHGLNIKKIFSPEHGIQVTGADGHFQASGVDAATGLSVVSLYSHQMKPSPDDLSDTDVLFFDIPDVGCRFYTYLWTLTYVMESCSESGIKLCVLDRPNPTGGNLTLAEGPRLNEASCASFIGRWDIPVRHCCTLGELARYFQATRLPQLDLTVIPCRNWNRHQPALASAGSFVPTSPAIKNLQTALLYPGTGLWEGIHVQEGRGTAHPFRMMGAPWIEPGLAEALETLSLPGLGIEAARFIPQSGHHAGTVCNGILLTVTNEELWRPVASGIAIIRFLLHHYPEQCREAAYPTLANPDGTGHLNKLLGVPDAFEQLREGQIFTSLDNWWQQEIAPYLLYPSMGTTGLSGLA